MAVAPSTMFSVRTWKRAKPASASRHPSRPAQPSLQPLALRIPHLNLSLRVELRICQPAAFDQMKVAGRLLHAGRRLAAHDDEAVLWRLEGVRVATSLVHREAMGGSVRKVHDALCVFILVGE